MEALYTIGYTKKSLKEFISRLKDAGVDCVVDVRLLNTSQLAGFAKRDDLEFLLEEGFDIRYVHMVDLAPSEEMLEEYKSGKDWDTYFERYTDLIHRRDMVVRFLEAAEEAGWKKPCLLCAEDTADRCHRRLLAEEIQEATPGLEVEHL